MRFNKKMLKKILRKKRLILICFCITFCVYLILNSFKQQSAAESKKLREQEEYHQNQIFLEAQPYNPICELPQLQIINHENTLPSYLLSKLLFLKYSLKFT